MKYIHFTQYLQNKATSTRAWTSAVFVKLGFDEGRVYSRSTVQSLAK